MSKKLVAEEIVSYMDSMLTGLAVIKMGSGGTELIYMNEGGYRMLGYTKEAGEKAAGKFLSLVLEEDKPIFFQGISDVLKDNGAVDITVRTVSNQGNLRYLQFVTNLYEKTKDGAIMLAAIHDVSDRCEVDAEIRRQTELFTTLSRAHNERLINYNAKADTLSITYIDGMGIHQLAYIDRYLDKSSEEVQVLPGGTFLYNMIASSLRYPKSEEKVGNICVDESVGEEKCRVFLSSVSGVEGYVSHVVGRIQEDVKIEEEDEAEKTLSFEEKIRQMGWGDAESGSQKISEILEENEKSVHAFYTVGLNSMGLVKEMFGRKVAEECTLKAAQILIDSFKRMDVTVWNENDEFQIFARDLHSIDVVEAIAKNITKRLNIPVEDGLRMMFIGVNVGVAVTPYHGSTFFELMEKSMSSMYESMDKDKSGYQIFEAEETLRAQLKEQLKNHKNEERADEWDAKSMTVSQLEATINDIFSAGSVNNTSIQTVMKLISEHFGFDRAYLSLRNEGTMEEQEVSYQAATIENIPFATKSAEFLNLVNQFKAARGMKLTQNYDMLQPEMAEYFIQEGIKTQLSFPMAIRGQMAGILFFQAMGDKNIELSETEKNELYRLIRLNEMYLLKFGKASNWKENLTKLQMLENFDSYVYLVDVKTKEICFANRKLMSEIPSLVIGDLSYRVLHHKTQIPENDETALLDSKNAQDSVSVEMFVEGLRKWLKLQVSWFINEGNIKICLVNGIDISEYFE